MGSRHAFWLIVLLQVGILIGVGRRQGAPPPMTRPSPPTCRHFVQVGNGVLCRRGLSRRRLGRAGVPPACLRTLDAGQIRRWRPGDRLYVERRGGACTLRVGRMSPIRLAILQQPVDVNRAGVAELRSLPGVGVALARRIVAARRRRGPYRRPADLLEVRGIGVRQVRRLHPRLRGFTDERYRRGVRLR